MKKKGIKKSAKQLFTKRKELKRDDMSAILARAKVGPLGEHDIETLETVIDTLAFLTQEVDAKGASITRLRKLLFGPSTEKTSKVLKDPPAKNKDKQPPDPSKPPKKRTGHGRNGAAAYTGAKKEQIEHPSLQHGDPCPECPKGKVYRQKKPKVLVRVIGVAPLAATVYELERLRCNLCGMIFTAPAPKGVGNDTHDETAASMIALLKYGCGLPLNRIEALGKNFGIPMPSGTQWTVLDRAYENIAVVYDALTTQAAQGDVLHNDDTPMKILELMKQNKEWKEKDQRTGMGTSGIVSVFDDHTITLFFTGRRHAGENLAEVLKKRAEGLELPIHMCDALAANTAGDFEAVLARCLTHGRRKFVNIVDNFPEECRRVINDLREVYKNDDLAKDRSMSPEDRLTFHQQESGPIMFNLKKWIEKQKEERTVEDNSPLGQAFAYFLKHWEGLTLFLRVPGAPLDNNVCERTLKKAILHRKNSLFYKTEHGAMVGDAFMSLIYTAESCNVNPFEYLVELQRNARRIKIAPELWMPWNFRQTIQKTKLE